MNQASNPGQMRRFIAKINSHFRKLESQEAERRRKLTQEIVDRMAESTPEARKAAAAARARSVHAKIDKINTEADLEVANNPAAVSLPSLDAVRIDDLEALFSLRDHLPDWHRERIKNIHAKINWITGKGKKGSFNVAVHKNNIPVDRTLTILSHIHEVHEGTRRAWDMWVDSVIECCQFYQIKRASIKKGKRKGQTHQFQYAKRCQDGEHCNQCNYINISDGLKVLLESYDESAFYRGGSYFAMTIAPRDDPAKAKAVGRTLTQEDWKHKNPESVVFRESHQGRVFKYGDVSDTTEGRDWQLESAIRRFLGAVQCVFGKLVKNGWLDGIRAKIENSIEFLPYACHQHWHGVGSSKCERDVQKLADFIKTEVDEILAQTCPGLYADVMVAVLLTPDDLQKWVRYMNKPVDLVGPVDSVYSRHSNLRRSDELFQELLQELCLYPERSSRVFGMIRFVPIEFDEHGAHTYRLNRRYVRGNHKFGTGSILSEPERHRNWRKAHANNEVESRRRGKLQNVAHYLGFRLEKCPKRFPEALGYGTYQIEDMGSKAIVAAGPSGFYGLSLGECAKFLNGKAKVNSRLDKPPQRSPVK